MKLRIVVLIVCGVVLAATVHAEPALKIGVVNFQKALNEVEQGKKAKAALKAEFDAKQKKLDLQQDELKKIREDLDKQKVVLSQESLKEKEKSFGEKYLALQQNMGNYQKELVGRESKLTSQILQNLRGIVGEIGQKEKFTLIVENSQDAVLYAESTEDLTDRIISLYNKRFSAPLKTD